MQTCSCSAWKTKSSYKQIFELSTNEKIIKYKCSEMALAWKFARNCKWSVDKTNRHNQIDTRSINKKHLSRAGVKAYTQSQHRIINWMYRPSIMRETTSYQLSLAIALVNGLKAVINFKVMKSLIFDNAFRRGIIRHPIPTPNNRIMMSNRLSWQRNGIHHRL